MPKKPVPKVIAWSYSKWNLYVQCPLKVKLSSIDKIREPKSPALDRGIKIHNLADSFIKGKLEVLPAELETFDNEFAGLRELYKRGDVDAEQMLCFDKDWKLLEDKWSPEVWVRIKMDATILHDYGVVEIIDFKTGKVKTDGYFEQLELYAIAGFLAYEGVEKVITSLWFIDHGEIQPPEDPMVFYKKDLPKLIKKWEGRIKRMMADRRFDPKPNEFCKWCFYRKNKGGQCKY